MQDAVYHGCNLSSIIYAVMKIRRNHYFQRPGMRHPGECAECAAGSAFSAATGPVRRQSPDAAASRGKRFTGTASMQDRTLKSTRIHCLLAGAVMAVLAIRGHAAETAAPL